MPSPVGDGTTSSIIEGITYDRTTVEGAVRSILRCAPNQGTARRWLLIMHGQQLPTGVSWVSGPTIKFEEDGTRRAHFTLTVGRGDDPLHIDVRVDPNELTLEAA